MAENLKVTTALITDSTWCSYLDTFPCIYPLETLEYSPYSYYNDSDEYEDYGLLYKRDICTETICPEGWRIPYSEDYWELFQYLGNTNTDNFSTGIIVINDSTISQKLRITGNKYWGENNSANNISGFSAIPSGIKQNYGNFSLIDTTAFYWNYKYNPNNSDHQYYHMFSIYTTRIVNLNTPSNWAGALLSASIRCIKD